MINDNIVINDNRKFNDNRVFNDNHVFINNTRVNINNQVNINNNINYNYDINIDGESEINDRENSEQNEYNDNYEEEDANKEERIRKKKEEAERLKKEREERIKREKEEEEKRKKQEKEEEEKRKKQEKERKKKERKWNTYEEFLKYEEERFKLEKEKIFSLNKEKVEASKKYEEDKEKQELKEKEDREKDANRWKKNQKVQVDFHTQKEIKIFSKEAMQAFDVGVKYDIEPKTTSPYNSGKMSKETHNNAIKLLNSLRFAAGLSHNIGLTDSYNKLAQDASLLCSVNDFLSHYDQPKPKNMNKNLYDSGAKGCASCNLGQGHIHINDSILGWVSDEDSGNFDRMGHRRWVLNPEMKDTGFGLVKEFSGMYSLDRNCPENKNTNVIWPTQNMPIEFFGDNYPWTLSTGRNITKKVVVTLTNKKTKKVIKFDKYTNNKFLVNNDGYGLTGCVIFRPNLKYSDGDSYQVDVN